jgi:DNA-binding LacI/PurR family transcriptional regulator
MVNRIPRQPAMTDVARLAGVSHQTVSRVLNDHPHVRERTRLLVMAAVQELGYQPNTVARALATGRTHTLGVVTLAGTLYGPASILNAIEAAARDEGYTVNIASRRPGEPVAEAVLRMHRQAVAGVIVIASHPMTGESLDDLATRIPLVLVEGRPGGDRAVMRVDQAACGRIATEYLLAQGHSTVWHIAGPEYSLEATERTAGWRAALTAAGAPVPEVCRGDWSPASGYTLGRDLSERPEVSAVFVANDQMALGLIRALREGGRPVPESVSVIGCDDIPEAAYFTPPLTTIRQPFDRVGRGSVRLLLGQIDSGPAHPDAPAYPDAPVDPIAPELIVRRSTAAR